MENKKFYVEVLRTSGDVSIVDIDIPRWGTPRGKIEEYDTIEEAEKAVKEWREYFDLIE